MKRSVIVVEANPALSFFLRYVLEGDQFDVECVARGDDALLLIDRKLPDVAVINWRLPGISGMELCRRLRAYEKTKNLLTILHVDCPKELNRIQHLSSISNAIESKFLSSGDFQYHVRTMIGETALARKLTIGGIILNIEDTCIEHKDKYFHLSPINFRLLQLFMRNPGRVFAREQLFAEAWDSESKYSGRTVDVHVARLRNDLTTAISKNPIRTVRGSGYYYEGNLA